MTEPQDDLRRALEALGHELVVALVGLDMQDRRVVRDSLERIVAHLHDTERLGATMPLHLDFEDHGIALDGQTLLGASLQAGRLASLAQDRHVAEMTFSPKLTADELERFVEFLADEQHRPAFRPVVLERALEQRGITSIGVFLRMTRGAAGRTEQGEETKALHDYQALATVLQENHVAAFHGDTLEIDRAAGVVELALAQMGSAPSELLALANYDDIDSFTVGHSVRVALLALQVAEAAGAGTHELLRVGTAALLHDIGKSRIPQEILLKPGRLDPEEWALMAEHPRLGAEILLEQKDIDPSAVGAAFCHHMAPDGDGYPRPTLSFAPSGISKLVRVCDVFEALTAVRPYKAALTPVEAHVIMHRQREHFDPAWLRFFVRVIGLYPLGTRLWLDTGETAVVERHGPSCDQPVVRLLSGPDGAPPDPGTPPVLTIGVAQGSTTRAIDRILTGSQAAADETDVARVVNAHEHPCLGPVSQP